MYKILRLLPTFLWLNAIAQINPGDSAADFSLKNIDGKYISLASLGEVKGAVLIFTCNHCPYSKAYEDRINEIHKKYAPKGFPVVAINPNDPKIEPEDSYENMIKRAKEKKYTFYYLQDATQTVAKTYGAQKTPHVFLLQRYDGGGWGVEYTGAIDDNPHNSKDVKERYLETAIRQLQDSVEVNPAITKAIGCGIKWKKQ